MERLTYNDDGCWQVHGADQNLCKQVCEEYSNCKSCPIGRAIDRLAEYENKGLEPSEVLTGLEMAKVAIALTELERWKATGLTIERATELGKADQEGRVVVLDEKTALSIAAGARAIATSKRLCGASYCRDVFRDSKKISYFEAANILYEIAEKALEAENRERL